MSELVTIGVPIYKRLDYLPNVLKVVASQDYPNIELLVSDNGRNGTEVPRIVDQWYPKPYTFRQNAETVSGSLHYNQVIQNASGEYVVVLADDDEISPNFVSDLLRLLKKHPEASAALAMEEVIDLEGNVLRNSSNTVPEIMSGLDFIRATWKTREYGYQSLCTFLARKEKLLAAGGFPNIWGGTSDEDVLMIKLALDSHIAFSTQSSFGKRFHEASAGLAQELRDLARGIHEFLACLDTDSRILQYAAAHPAEWKELRATFDERAWQVYKIRWADMYKRRLPPAQWVAAAFTVPFRQGGASLASFAARSALVDAVKRVSPKTYSAYRTAKTKLFRMT